MRGILKKGFGLKAIVGMMLALTLIIGIMPMMKPEEVKAIVSPIRFNENDSKILTDGKYISSSGVVTDNQPSEGYAHLDGSVLTLHDFTYSVSKDAMAISSSMTIVLEGTNVVTANDYYKTAIICNESGTTLTISGSGSLKATGGNGIYTNKIVIKNGIVKAVGTSVCGLYGFDDGVLIESGTIYATGKNYADPQSYAVNEFFSEPSNMIITGSTTYNAPISSLEAVTWDSTNMNYYIGSNKTMTLYFKSPSSAGSLVAETSYASACNHHYEWVVNREPTETQEGELVYKCSICGNIIARQPISSYEYYIYKCVGKINNAKAGDTVVLSSTCWNSYPKSFFEKLAVRRDITLEVKFTYNHKNYEMTITPNQAIDTSSDYYGPLKLMELYGASEVTK